MASNQVIAFSVLLVFCVGLSQRSAGQSAIWEQKYEVFDNSCEPNGSASQVIEIVSAPNGHLFFSDPGSLFRSLDYGNSWEYAPFSVDHITGIVPISSSELLIGIYGSTGGVYRVTENGDSWTLLGVSENIDGLIATDDRSLIIAIPADQGLFMSTDEGATWEKTHPQWNVSTVQIAPNGRVYLRSDQIYQSENGMDWSEFSSSRFPFPTNDPGVLLATDNDGVFRSTDNGQFWELVLSSNKPLLLRNSEDTLVAVSKEGRVDLSEDQGESWSPLISFPDLPCGNRSAVTIDGNGHIWLGSSAGVVFRSSQTTFVGLERNLAFPELPTLATYPNPTNTVLNMVLENAVPQPARLRVVDFLGRVVLTLQTGNATRGEFRYQLDVSDLPAGIYAVHSESSRGTRTRLVTILQ